MLTGAVVELSTWKIIFPCSNNNGGSLTVTSLEAFLPRSSGGELADIYNQ